jgi:hypothetical protein
MDVPLDQGMINTVINHQVIKKGDGVSLGPKSDMTMQRFFHLIPYHGFPSTWP